MVSFYGGEVVNRKEEVFCVCGGRGEEVVQCAATRVYVGEPVVVMRGGSGSA